MSLSIATTSIPGDLPTKLRAIAAAGFTGIELHEPDFTGFAGTAGEVRSLAGELGLTIHVLQPFHDLEGQADPAARLARLDAKLALAAELGCETLLVGSAARVAPGRGDAAALAADLRQAAELAAMHGLRLAYLALPWGASVTTDAQALALVEKADHPQLGLAVNSFFSLAGGARPAVLRDIPGDRVFHVQLSDAPRTDVDIRGLKHHFGLLPGQGGLNLEGVVRVLCRAGYDGPWSIARVSDFGRQPSAPGLARDGFRALVSLLDAVQRTLPAPVFPIPELPDRVRARGFEFIEFAVDGAARERLSGVLEALCFRLERHHISKSVELWRQGAVNIVVNSEAQGLAREAFRNHGPCVCDMGLRVTDAARTVARATALGTEAIAQPVGLGELDIPAIRGVGGAVLHFIDEKSDLHRVWDIEFAPVSRAAATPPAGLRRIDHLAQTMAQDEMQSWLLYYLTTFEMAKSEIVDVADPAGAVLSQAIETPEGEVRLNLNGAAGRQTFAGAFLAGQVGPGVQHIAFLSDDIFETSARLAEAGFARLEIPANYYADLQTRFGLSEELTAGLQAASILFDRDGSGEYFQIYSQPIFGGFFFEIVERRGGYAGYGARNAPIRLAAQMRSGLPARGAA